MQIKSAVNSAHKMTEWSHAAATWMCEVLCERFELPVVLECRADRWHLSLKNDDGVIWLDANPTIFTRADSELPCTNWDAAAEGWRPILGKPMPAPGTASLPSPLIEKSIKAYTIHYDILGLVYWMLTRQEEVGRTDLDEHGRFPAASSHAFRHGYLERPIVDEWLDILRQVIERTWPGIELKRPKFSMKVSHDVDAPARYGFRPWRGVLRGMAGDIFKRGDMRALLAPWIRLHTRENLHRWDAGNTFDWLMDVSGRHNLQSAFYFICERRGTAHDSDYDLEHPAIRGLIRRIHARGHEVGLHPSYSTYLEPAQIKREAERLRRVCAEECVVQAQWGGRMHYLQWRQPETLRAWSGAEMDYDSTMTYANHAGFRCGTCFEYPAFDPVAGEELNLRVRPLVVMEGSVFGKNYMGLGVSDAARDMMLELKNACRTVGGCFTLLWHNSSFQTHAERHMYETVVGD